MATISLRDVILYDRWPGYPDPNLSEPTSGFDASAQCSTAPVWPIGTKIQKYNDSTLNPGYFTMAYLQFCEGSDSAYDAGDPSTGYGACFRYDATQHLPDGQKNWFKVTHDLTNSDGTRGGAVAFPAFDLSGADTTTTDNEFGWFWCGGVNPCITTTGFADCTRLAGEVKTDGDIKAGVEFCFEDDGTNAASIIPYCMTAIFEVTLGYDATIFCGPSGYALAADA